MYNPISTYRVQLYKGFTLADLESIIPYLASLGVRTIYAAPVFQAVPGSVHGYDCVDPHHINKEIGTEEDLLRIRTLLDKYEMGWIQDIVPNHMAYHPQNNGLMDVLEQGSHAHFAGYFDIYADLDHESIMAPFLGSSLDEVLQRRELKIVRRHTRCYLQYFDQHYPLKLTSYPLLFAGIPIQPLQDWVQLVLADASAKNRDVVFNQLDALLHHSDIIDAIDERLVQISEDERTLKDVALHQYYRLCHWQETHNHINYRRFFTINGLICLNIHNPEVFEWHHAKLAQWVAKGIIDGVRVDHVDGLQRPDEYLQRLRMLLGSDAYVSVEKILEPKERLSSEWPAQGTTGYDFMAMVNQLMINQRSEKQFERFYSKLTGNEQRVHRQLRSKKEDVLYKEMAGELEYLYQQLLQSGVIPPDTPSTVLASLKDAVASLLVYCPVYRLYPNSIPLTGGDATVLSHLFGRIINDKPWLQSLIQLMNQWWLVGDDSAEMNRKALHLLQRLMQFSGPLMAKGKEDTLMYTYNLFIGHNDVGDSVDDFGMTVDQFHLQMVERGSYWPLTMNATATHDTKRGEDARARLQALADMPSQWLSLAHLWLNYNGHQILPDKNERYLMLQTLVAVYPMDGSPDNDFRERLRDYVRKAIREAGIHSNWKTPAESYEDEACAYVDQLLDPPDFVRVKWQAFQEEVNDYGMLYSLIQLLLKCTCPGIPDIYQGNEIWDLNLVDPDNRRPVDYAIRQRMLEELDQMEISRDQLIPELWSARRDGRIKLWLTRLLLLERQSSISLFEKGSYIPLPVKGRYQKHVLAFARRYDQEWRVVIAGLNIPGLCRRQRKPIDQIEWGNTYIEIPSDFPVAFRSLWNDVGGRHRGRILLSDVLLHLPMAVLKFQGSITNRKAGVLLPVFSLPSAYGIGDLGPLSRKFVDFLVRAKQRIWQILPLNPVDKDASYSPYSSISAMAGNTLLVSPDLLVNAGLLWPEEVDRYKMEDADQVVYEHAVTAKSELIRTAYERYKKEEIRFSIMKHDFAEYCRREAFWLDDFALFDALKREFDEPWMQWPEVYKLRNPESLRAFISQHDSTIELIKWSQFIFEKQWEQLKAYCKANSVQLLGDLPFYVSHDSADVWAHPEFFSIDETGSATGIAGVPPDYFSADGQLWGMPTFNWAQLKASNYDWWIQRLKRNLRFFDWIRLDHFRAFEAYWELPAGVSTARMGEWKPGPGTDFFVTIEAALGRSPFIAEDLGDEMQAVYQLRDAVKLPGMKVLQFAFGSNIAQSVDIPHNYPRSCVVYTGTHDNNTSLGWYQEEASEADKKRLDEYLGVKVRTSTVHEHFIRMGYASVADWVIVPMQDVLGLGGTARINTPGTIAGNWTWRLLPGKLTGRHARQLRNWVDLFNR